MPSSPSALALGPDPVLPAQPAHHCHSNRRCPSWLLPAAADAAGTGRPGGGQGQGLGGVSARPIRRMPPRDLGTPPRPPERPLAASGGLRQPQSSGKAARGHQGGLWGACGGCCEGLGPLLAVGSRRARVVRKPDDANQLRNFRMLALKAIPYLALAAAYGLVLSVSEHQGLRPPAPAVAWVGGIAAVDVGVEVVAQLSDDHPGRLQGGLGLEGCGDG